MSAMDVSRYKPKGWTKYFVDGPVEVELSDSAPRVNIEYEEFGSLRACPNDSLLECVTVEDDEKRVVYTHCIDTEDFKPSGHRYIISVYNKLTNKKLTFHIGEDDMKAQQPKPSVKARFSLFTCVASERTKYKYLCFILEAQDEGTEGDDEGS